MESFKTQLNGREYLIIPGARGSFHVVDHYREQARIAIDTRGQWKIISGVLTDEELHSICEKIERWFA
jgi:hypothetical protein